MDVTPSELGRRIAGCRSSAGMDRGMLANATGLTVRKVGRVERGERGLSIPELLAMSRAMQVPAGTLLGCEETARLVEDASQARHQARQTAAALDHEVEALLAQTGRSWVVSRVVRRIFGA